MEIAALIDGIVACNRVLMPDNSSILSQRQASLRALYAVTNLLDNNADLSTLCDLDTSPPDTSEEAVWLKANSISR